MPLSPLAVPLLLTEALTPFRFGSPSSSPTALAWLLFLAWYLRPDGTFASIDPPLLPPDPPVLPGSKRAREIAAAYARFSAREHYHRGGTPGAQLESLGPRHGVWIDPHGS